jgi:hypothetical protein
MLDLLSGKAGAEARAETRDLAGRQNGNALALLRGLSKMAQGVREPRSSRPPHERRWGSGPGTEDSEKHTEDGDDVRGIVLTLANDVIGTCPRLQMLADSAEATGTIDPEFVAPGEATRTGYPFSPLPLPQGQEQGFLRRQREWPP